MSHIGELYTYQLSQFSQPVSISRALETSKTGMVCSSTIKWHSLDGSVSSITSGLYDNCREARKNALRAAIQCGYTYPKWWQWWRWSEARPNLDFSKLP